MFVTLFILLFIAQPANGQQVKASNKSQTKAQQQNEAPKDSASKPTIIPAPLTNGGNHYYTTNKQEPSHDEDWYSKLANWLLVIFTGIIAGYSFRQYSQARKDSATQSKLFRDSNDISRESMQRQLRAYISIQPRLARIPEAENWTLGKFYIINSGQTPAYKINTWFYVIVGPPNQATLPRALLSEVQSYAFPVIHTGSEVRRTGIVPNTINLGERTVADIKNGISALYYCGEVQYEDAFGFSHKTGFRYECQWTNKGLSRPRLCAEGNEAD
jgi:hypothetical protein